MSFEVYTHAELEDKYIGPVGSPKRDEYERRIAAEMEAYRVGEALKQVRLKQHLTQAELGQRIGVGRSWISKLEKGYNMSLPTMSRVFKALGVATASLDLGGNGGRVTLW